MFEVGDSVVCKRMFGIPNDVLLELNKIYVIVFIQYSPKSSSMIVLKGIKNAFNVSRFISLVEFRKNKINKLKEIIND